MFIITPIGEETQLFEDLQGVEADSGLRLFPYKFDTRYVGGVGLGQFILLITTIIPLIFSVYCVWRIVVRLNQGRPASE
jgi:hypothetical protein